MAVGTDQSQKLICVKLIIRGIVQGVGFRPFIYRLAQEHNLKGWVRNENCGVALVVEGEPGQVRAFRRKIALNHPELADISDISAQELPRGNYSGFQIHASSTLNAGETLVSPDLVVCPDCLEEVNSSHDRHYLYPFTNCTNCGPRFTIISGSPYDRDKTSMKGFRPCLSCREEYQNPADRRFHAQPVACPDCGPSVALIDSKNKIIETEDWQAFFWREMQRGAIFAVKGLGGFHLTCQLDGEAIARLRNRKQRLHKPFAVMCRNLETVSKYCHLDLAAEKLLMSPSAPVVVLPVKRKELVPSEVNPHLETLGVMLPYTPLHHLLLQGPLDSMVCTSANLTDLPIIKDDAEAVNALARLVDYYLLHNRNIVQRCDDSVAHIVCGQPQFIRRSRGYVPKPLQLGFTAEKTVLGAGGEMKNTFCLIGGKQAKLSQHLGELGTLQAASNYWETLNHFKDLFGLRPEIVGFDPHPGYTVSAQVQRLPGCQYYAVQHHHAHFASCLAENRCNDKDQAIGIILDGTGYGLDGAVWGFEVISGGFQGFRREYHHDYVYLPGGDSAVKWPWRAATGYLFQSMGAPGLAVAEQLFGELYADALKIISLEMKSRRSQTLLPYSSCGRLFDAVAALLGICYENTYEGQAAIQLGEMLVSRKTTGPLNYYSFNLNENCIDFSPMIADLIEDISKNTAADIVVSRFHDTLVQALLAAVQLVSEKTGLKTAALSGGSWHNEYLLKRAVFAMEKLNLDVMLQRHVPPNDGGISLGQAAVAYWRWKNGVSGHSHEDC